MRIANCWPFTHHVTRVPSPAADSCRAQADTQAEEVQHSGATPEEDKESVSDY